MKVRSTNKRAKVADRMPVWDAFRDAVDMDLDRESRMQYGENDCVEFTDAGVGSYVLAISQLVRGGDPTQLADEIFATGSAQDVADLVTLMFATRNARGGKGEKKLAHRLFFSFKARYPTTALAVLPLFKEYGYWKDFLLLTEMAIQGSEAPVVAEKTRMTVCELMRDQLRQDIASLGAYTTRLATASGDDAKDAIRKAGPGISLLAKWLPREKSHFDRKDGVNFSSVFMRLMWPELCTSQADGEWASTAKAKYRKTVTELTEFLQLPEVLLASHRTEEINFGKLSARATLILSKALLNEDKKGDQRSDDPKRIRLAERFIEHALQNGLKGGQLYPHEIVKRILAARRISPQEEIILDAQWKNLWAKVVHDAQEKAAEEGLEFNPTKMVPLCDVSGSMSGVPMEVAIALGIGVSEITHPAFQHMVLTFESQPRWHRLNASDTIVAKVRSLQEAPWGGSTNFEAAYDLILKVCVEHRLRRDEMPTLIVFSDMQFNEAAGHGHFLRFEQEQERTYSLSRAEQNQTMFETIKAKVRAVAPSLGITDNGMGWVDAEPTPLVFWNLRNTGGHPVSNDTEGAVLLSGYSASLLKLVLNGTALEDEEVEVVSVKSDGSVSMTREKVRVTPKQVLRRMLDDSQYDPVREILLASEEGKLSQYTGGRDDAGFASSRKNATLGDYIAMSHGTLQLR
jgi:hypothetical protein